MGVGYIYKRSGILKSLSNWAIKSISFRINLCSD